ncbi:TonB family C-terminal domain-containing protein [Pustulibacterium marinum]|uniref:TonB family C-terminal domain-containing protein n=1 Tax=Pustulibacterium marinum TaxID=1224947 RepID=A0A1I7EWZ8_9FLAO|nr:energy transducer TonB [Pustulibacterium marinum]SFU28453.1 TonB family C-terminal domain-containing protein [Pustulibacterium marinum]
MRLNKNHYAFIISALILLNVIVFSYAINLNKVKKEDQYVVEMVMEPEPEKLPEKEEIPEKITHQAINKEIKTSTTAENNYQTLEEFLEAPSEEDQNDEMEETEAIENEEDISKDLIAENTGIESIKKAAERRKRATQKNLGTVDPDKILKQNKKSGRATTITYSLKDRIAVKKIPNPVYTCEAGGKVVINIKVNHNGTVTDTEQNIASSTTTNACLVENAMYYAKKAKFNANPQKTSQIGTITYFFQGK